MNFKTGDRVRFTEEHLAANADYIDPATPEDELRGTVVSVEGDQLTVEFDNEITETYSAQVFGRIWIS